MDTVQPKRLAVNAPGDLTCNHFADLTISFYAEAPWRTAGIFSESPLTRVAKKFCSKYDMFRYRRIFAAFEAAM